MADPARTPASSHAPVRRAMERSRRSSSMDCEQLAHEGRAAFEAEGDHGHPPAVVLVADPVGHRHPDLVEEQLAELGRAGDGAQRPDVDAGAVHGQDQPRDAPVAAVLGPGAHQQLAVVGHLGVRRPDLLAR